MRPSQRRHLAVGLILGLALLGTSAVAAPAAVTLVRGPYLQRVTWQAATIRWRTSAKSASEVHWGDAPGALVNVVANATSVTEHELTIPGLAPQQRVFYSIGYPGTTLAGDDPAHAFTTAPTPDMGTPLRLWAVGDPGRGNLGQLQVRDAAAAYMAGHPADVWLMLGDNAYTNGTDTEYQTELFDVYADLLTTTTFYPTRGNHDVVVSGANNDYFDFFTLPAAGEAGGVPSGTEAFYSVDRGSVHLVCLDSEGSAFNAAMLTWLRQDLAATNATWTIAFWHHPPYTKGTHDSDDPTDSEGKMEQMREVVLPVLDSLGVDLVLCGHSHVYERSFLVAGHYGLSTTLAPSMVLDAGDGQDEGTGPYRKPTEGRAPNEGIVYVVSGTGALAESGPLDHPVMAVSTSVLGSLVIDVDGTRLDTKFVTADGDVEDHFTILKGSGVAGVPPPTATSLRLTGAGANPSALLTRLRFVLPAAAPARLTIVDAAGRRVATLADGPQAAGSHTAAWSGTAEAGGRAPAGLYFAVLESGGARRTLKVVRLR
jgi:3',5'-cyclic AMP phosphodiesterase CpdA